MFSHPPSGGDNRSGNCRDLGSAHAVWVPDYALDISTVIWPIILQTRTLRLWPLGDLLTVIDLGEHDGLIREPNLIRWTPNPPYGLNLLTTLTFHSI